MSINRAAFKREDREVLGEQRLDAFTNSSLVSPESHPFWCRINHKDTGTLSHSRPQVNEAYNTTG